MKKKLLFVINTLSRAGAEVALLELLRALDPEKYDISLFVLMGQGELLPELPDYVRVRNRDFCEESVLTGAGRRHMVRTVLRALASRGTALRRFPYLLGTSVSMLRRGRLMVDKLLWPVMADGAMRMEERFDLAVAFLEGGAACYVANHVKADKKAAFIHIDYAQAGYDRTLDGSCYLKFDRIFTVSEEIQEPFYRIYPELRGRLAVFPNILNAERIRRRAEEPGGFPGPYDGVKILTVARLSTQKALEISIDAMKLLKEQGIKARWYVLGEGDQRSFLEERIRRNGLEENFILAGAVDNPYPWYAQTDLYVHCTRYEGKSIAIQEAQLLGCALLVSDCSGNREQVADGVDGLLCELTPEGICRGIRALLSNPDKTNQYRRAAAEKNRAQQSALPKLLDLISRDTEAST